MKYLSGSRPKRSVARSFRGLFFIAVIGAILLTSSSLCLGQGPTAESKSVQTEPTRENNLLSEDVYFNSQAREVLSPIFLSADKVSATSIGKVLTLLFDSAKVSLQTASDPMVATWVGTVTMPTRTGGGRKPRSYLQDVRGAVNKTADTRVRVFLELGGKGFVAEFPYGMKFNGNIVRRFVSVIRPSSSPRYTATIVIFAERRNTNGAVLVDIDGLDVHAR